MKRRLLVTGAGTTAASNLIRSLKADARPPIIIGCHGDRFVLKKSEADRNYLMPGLDHPGFFRAVARVIKKERIDLLIPTSDAEVRVFARRRARSGAGSFSRGRGSSSCARTSTASIHSCGRVACRRR